jgi:hypothetical protein
LEYATPFVPSTAGGAFNVFFDMTAQALQDNINGNASFFGNGIAVTVTGGPMPGTFTITHDARSVFTITDEEGTLDGGAIMTINYVEVGEYPEGPATGALAGYPGVWTPYGATAPATVTDLQAGIPETVVASPLTTWQVYEFVITADALHANWDGAAWILAPTLREWLETQNIPTVQAWVDDHADWADEVLAAERARGGGARRTLIDWLEGFIAHRDEEPNEEPEADDSIAHRDEEPEPEV